MATWKKVVVSGSGISQLANDSGYVLSTTVPNTYSTASAGGTILISNSTTGSLSFVSSSGQGLTLVGSTSPNTITFGLSAIPNASLLNPSVLIGGQTITLGAAATTTLTGLTSVTATSFTGSFTGSHFGILTGTSSYATQALTSSYSNTSTSASYAVSASWAPSAGGTVTSVSASGTVSGITLGGGPITTSGTLTLGGTISGLTNSNLSGTAGITNANLATPSLMIGTTGIALGATGSSLAGLTSVTATNFTGTASYASVAPYSGLTGIPSGLVSGSSQVTYSGLTGIPSGIISSSAQLPTGTVSGSSQITYSGLTGIPVNIVSASVLSSATQGTALLTTNGVAGTTIGLGLQTTDSPTFTNLVVNGNFSVLGTTTSINTANLNVADQFILVSSGSANNSTDGGIVVDRGAYAAQNTAFGYDSTTFRWGLQNGLADLTNTIDLGAGSQGVSGSFIAHVFTETTHGATKPTTGEFVVPGAIYTTAAAGDIWIYS